MIPVAERARTTGREPGDRRGRLPRSRAWPYLVPLLFGLAVWVYGPLLFTGVLSVLDWDLVAADAGFAGTANYARLVTEPEFPAAVARTGLYVAGLLPFATVVPILLAIMLWKRPGRASEMYRALLVLPIMLAPVATAVAWQFILNPLQGVVNAVLGGLGLPRLNWLGDPGTALPVIVLVTAAKVVSLNTLLFGAALAGLDRRGVEAARVDGATEWEVTRFVLVPQLLPTAALLGALCVVLASQWVFTNVAVLTQGGPDGATDNVYYRLYTYGFTFFDVGTASAGAVVIVAALGLIFAGRAALARRRDAAV
ncbi:sugar ABC transporter permease [Pseudonocardia sp. DSM 110487]|uniref:carbohydrate ABC transporter permease n=1 Tax=Pseudonocardia sp. DSM 110487 TaxID=2865833 RepID=UPI001C695AC0|nr:sugar ABC transporter permease [Pseudonocardia sp. DSM 110487]QYN39008.1 sugar ABC transporter permease [Pseudonocardia sp. DSM 110487]